MRYTRKRRRYGAVTRTSRPYYKRRRTSSRSYSRKAGYRSGSRKYRRGGYRRRGAFRRRVQTIVARTNGLIVEQTAIAFSMNSFAQFANPVFNPSNAIQVITCMAPADIAGFVGRLTPTTDSKCMIRQNKMDLYMHNETNTPIWLKATYFRCKKAISAAEFPNWTSLLEAQAIPSGNYCAAVTTSNVAQRYLKFGKTKLKTIPAGHIYHMKLNCKYGALTTTQEDWADTSLLGTKMTCGVILKVIPPPHLWYNNAPASATTYMQVPTPQGWKLTIIGMEYVSGYSNGLTNPNSTYYTLPTPTTPATQLYQTREYGTDQTVGGSFANGASAGA